MPADPLPLTPGAASLGPAGSGSAGSGPAGPRPLLQPLDQVLFDRVAAEARESPRLRRNHNLHAEPDLVQRFLNVLQPGTYVRPHRHRRALPGAGFECFVVLQGAIGLLLLDEAGRVLRRERLDAAGPLRGIELAEGQIHTLVALSPDAVMFEIKQGPYEPTADKDFLAPFPAEGTAAAVAQERAWRALFDHPCSEAASSTPPVAPPVPCQG
jgi:cupin fold WbuC family metalloprotein